MNATIPFAKMSGAGNDFVVVSEADAARIGIPIPAWARAVCRRGLSVGADGVLVVGPAGSNRVRARFFNPDGSSAFCGNGTRCAARFAQIRGFAGAAMVIDTVAGDVPATLDGAVVRLELPMPEDRGAVTLDRSGGAIRGRWIFAGSPHFVIPVPDVSEWPLAATAPWIRRHPAFGSEGVNVDVVSDEPDGSLRIRTWERGVEGETLSCGSGALAAARLAFDAGRSGPLRIVPESGIPLVLDRAEAASGPLRLTLAGDARWVFSGELGAESIVNPDGM